MFSVLRISAPFFKNSLARPQRSVTLHNTSYHMIQLDLFHVERPDDDDEIVVTARFRVPEAVKIAGIILAGLLLAGISTALNRK